MIPQKGKRIALMAAVVLLACMSAGCRQHIETGNQKQPYTIGAVTKSKDSEYWMSVCSGMEKAADDFGVSVNSYDTKILKKGIPYIGMDNKKWEKSLRRLWRISWKMGQLRLSTIQEKPFRAMIRERRYSVQREWRQQAMIRQARGLLNLKTVYTYSLLIYCLQIPHLRLPDEEEKPIGIWGQRHLDYLKQYRRITYTNFLTSGRLNAYLADIDRQAQERSHRLIEGMKQEQGITEQLKEENTLEWTGRLGNIRACAREIVNEEIIFA